MNPQLVVLLIALIEEAPKLAVQVLGIWHQQGKLSAEEIAAFIAGKWPDAESFFKPAAPGGAS